jgi:hypothetical protein
METKITVCENRFEVVCDQISRDEMFEVLVKLSNWLAKKEEPSEEDYMAALGPCGK